VERCCGAMLWSDAVDQCCGAMLWSDAVERCCGAMLWSGAVERCCGAVLWSNAVEQCCGAMLWSGPFGVGARDLNISALWGTSVLKTQSPLWGLNQKVQHQCLIKIIFMFIRDASSKGQRTSSHDSKTLTKVGLQQRIDKINKNRLLK